MARRIHKIWLALGLLGAGLVCALPFRRSEPLTAPQVGSSVETVTRRGDDSPLKATPLAGREALAGGGETPGAGPPVAPAPVPEPGGASALNEPVALPQLVEEYPARENPTSPPTAQPTEPEAAPGPRLSTAHRAAAAAVGLELAQRPPASAEAPVPRPAKPEERGDFEPTDPDLRRHRLMDGDTLEALAERYLGDSARALEIYTLNKPLLTNPELLPLGVELKIPPRDAAAASVSAVQSPLATNSPESAPEVKPSVDDKTQARGVVLKLSPLPPVAPPRETTAPTINIAPTDPRAIAPLVPILERRSPAISTPATNTPATGAAPTVSPPVGTSTSQTPMGKTYYVRPGDTWESIAQKLYANPARAGELQRLNQTRVAPNTLRPGIFIIVP